MDPRVQNMADVLVNYSIDAKPGQWVVINTTNEGEPLADACAASVIRAGGYPTVQLGSERIQETVLREANDQQLAFVSPVQKLVFDRADATIAILAPRNTHNLSHVDPAKMAIQSKARREITDTYMRRWKEGTLAWTGCQFPTEAAAQDAHMSLREYEDFVYGACLLDRPDPVAAWRELGEQQQRLIDWLQDKSEIHITGHGTDLRVGIAGRSWINDLGRENFPGGEVFTGPMEDGTEGTIQFNYPAVRQGREVDGIRLVFEAGKVIDFSANVDESFLGNMLDMDEGARRLGEFAFGTNPGIQQFTRNTLFDEKISGTLHMALGMSVPGTGSNQSALHWDFVYNLREGAEVRVDGTLFSKNGEFQI